jgi:hypothetical protein
MWQQFIELTERRNLAIHTGLTVSRQYIEVCQANGVEIKTSVGKKLRIDREYFSKSCYFIAEFGAKLGIVIWKTTQKDATKDQDSFLINLTYGLLHDEEYDLARRILEFAFESPKKNFGNPETRLICLVNLALSYKWLGQEDKCIATVDKEAFSLTSEKYRLANLVLRNNFFDAATLMRRIPTVGDGSIKMHDYESWSLFRTFREAPEFKAAFFELFPDAVETREIPKELSNLADGSLLQAPAQNDLAEDFRQSERIH